MTGIVRRTLIAVVVLVIAGALTSSVYFYRQYQTLKQASTAPKIQVKDVLANVGKLMVLPTGEEPTVATVSDAQKLKDQPFFISAQNGDQVLIYTLAKKAILYRPSLNKIIDVAPVTIGVPATESARPADQASTFILWNGTTTVGITKTYTVKLKQKVPTATVMSTANAKKQSYDTTLLVDLTGANAERATAIASALGITVSSFPAGEVKPTGADFLIILGADQK